MRSRKMDRLKPAEDAFGGELAALMKGVRRQEISGAYSKERKELFKVALRYMDELNKVRPYACPLSTNILLSSISESILLALILDNIERARVMRIWTKAENDKTRKGPRLNPDVPLLTFAELIQMADELRLLRTQGLQNKIDAIVCEKLGLADLGIGMPTLIPPDTKRNREILHGLRDARNAVHPVKVVLSTTEESQQDFLSAVWKGLRICAALNQILGYGSPLANP
jgi:hypothetical protein